MTTILIVLMVLAVLGAMGYLAACAGAERFLTFKEWW